MYQAGARFVVDGIRDVPTVLDRIPRLASWTAENDLPLWAAATMNHKTGSLFPIFPWTGFILMGVVTAYWAEKRAARIDESKGPLSQQMGGSLAVFGGALAIERRGQDRSWQIYSCQTPNAQALDEPMRRNAMVSGRAIDETITRIDERADDRERCRLSRVINPDAQLSGTDLSSRL